MRQLSSDYGARLAASRVAIQEEGDPTESPQKELTLGLIESRSHQTNDRPNASLVHFVFCLPDLRPASRGEVLNR